MQDALLAALAANRDPAAASSQPWLVGTIRRRAAFVARSAARRQSREAGWQAMQPAAPMPDCDPACLETILAGLSPSLKAVAALALSGHSRPEIAYLLRIGDAALRQRLSALKRWLMAHDVPWPETTPGLTLPLDYGRLRDALLRTLIQQGGHLASHDPDGHLFVLRGSQTGQARQHGADRPTRSPT